MIITFFYLFHSVLTHIKGELWIQNELKKNPSRPLQGVWVVKIKKTSIVKMYWYNCFRLTYLLCLCHIWPRNQHKSHKKNIIPNETLYIFINNVLKLQGSIKPVLISSFAQWNLTSTLSAVHTLPPLPISSNKFTAACITFIYLVDTYRRPSALTEHCSPAVIYLVHSTCLSYDYGGTSVS